MIDNVLSFLLPIFLVFVIFSQVWEKRELLKRESKDKEALLEEIAKLQTALISRSGQEYAAARAMDTVLKDEKLQKPQDEVDVSELSDEEYDKLINREIEKVKEKEA